MRNIEAGDLNLPKLTRHSDRNVAAHAPSFLQPYVCVARDARVCHNIACPKFVSRLFADPSKKECEGYMVCSVKVNAHLLYAPE